MSESEVEWGGGSCAEAVVVVVVVVPRPAPIIALSQCSAAKGRKNGPRSQLIECKRFEERTGREWSERPSGLAHKNHLWSSIELLEQGEAFVRRWF